jgi:hypothetical protein
MAQLEALLAQALAEQGEAEAGAEGPSGTAMGGPAKARVLP